MHLVSCCCSFCQGGATRSRVDGGYMSLLPLLLHVQLNMLRESLLDHMTCVRTVCSFRRQAAMRDFDTLTKSGVTRVHSHLSLGVITARRVDTTYNQCSKVCRSCSQHEEGNLRPLAARTEVSYCSLRHTKVTASAGISGADGNH
jgi:hypothetical protein